MQCEWGRPVSSIVCDYFHLLDSRTQAVSACGSFSLLNTTAASLLFRVFLLCHWRLLKTLFSFSMPICAFRLPFFVVCIHQFQLVLLWLWDSYCYSSLKVSMVCYDLPAEWDTLTLGEFSRLRANWFLNWLFEWGENEESLKCTSYCF